MQIFRSRILAIALLIALVVAAGVPSARAPCPKRAARPVCSSWVLARAGLGGKSHRTPNPPLGAASKDFTIADKLPLLLAPHQVRGWLLLLVYQKHLTCRNTHYRNIPGSIVTTDDKRNIFSASMPYHFSRSVR